MRNYLDTLAHHKWRAVLLVILLTSAVVAGSVFFLRSYVAKSSIWTEAQTIFIPTSANPWASQTASQQSVEQVYELLQTRVFVETIAKNAGYPGQTVDGEVPEAVINELRSGLSASWNGPHIVTISFRGDNPEVTTNVVSATLTLFSDTVMKMKREDATLAVSFYQNQLEIYRSQLSLASEELRVFKEKYPPPADPRVERPPAQEQELQRLDNQYKIYSGLYETVLRRLDEARMIGAAQVQGAPSSFRILDPPETPLERSIDFKKVAMYGLAAFCLALGIVLILGALENWMNESVRTSRDLSEKVDVPILSVMPYVKPRRRKKRQRRESEEIQPQPVPMRAP